MDVVLTEEIYFAYQDGTLMTQIKLIKTDKCKSAQSASSVFYFNFYPLPPLLPPYHFAPGYLLLHS